MHEALMREDFSGHVGKTLLKAVNGITCNNI